MPTACDRHRNRSVAGDGRGEPRGSSITGTGYVVESLEAALWAFARSDSFGEGVFLAVNLGDNADTTGAIYGQIAGAFYGAEQIPAEWTLKLTMHDFILQKADQLFAIAQPSNPDWCTAAQQHY